VTHSYRLRAGLETWVAGGGRTLRQQNRSSSRSSSARMLSGMARASFSVRWSFPPLGAGAGAAAGVGDGVADGTAVMTCVRIRVSSGSVMRVDVGDGTKTGRKRLMLGDSSAGT